MGPNIVFLLADDLGWRDLTCYGSTFYETPRLDRLALEGVRFTDAYAACPVCSPSRASLLTGKYPARVGVTNWIYGQERGKLEAVPFLDHLPDGEWTLAEALREGGYQNWHVGKWHLGGAELITQHGFDVNIGGCHWGHPKEGYFAPFHNPAIDDRDIPEGTYLDTYLTDRAIDLIRNRDKNRPFFLNLWFYLVHMPAMAPEALVEKYRRKARKLGLDQVNPIAEGERFPCEHKRNQRVQRRVIQSDPVYAAMVEMMDWNIGRLLDALEAEGLFEDTLVIFSSDNGGLSTAEGSPTCNAPLREGKGWITDGGLREPLIARYPGCVPAGTVTDAVFTSPDLYPTLLDFAGLAPLPQQHVDGVSARPAMEGRPCAPRGPIYWHYPHYGNQGGTPACAVRDGRYKLIEYFEDRHVELYDLICDPSECDDLSLRLPEVRDRLSRMLAAWRDSEVHGKVPARNPDYDPFD
jgi:arylsulfatase A-like enzyme